MAIDAKDVGELQKALNDAAGKASVLWTTFITFELYLAIAFGSVTHRDLFLETPIKLPLLNIDLPLVGFFVVAPAVLVVFHFYVFLQLLALTKKANDYDTLLRQEAPVASDRQYLRQRLDSFLVLQFLAGPAKQRMGFSGFSLRLIGWLTLVGIPIVILLQGHVTFLPYHLEWIVWLQRLFLLIDLAIIWYFWGRVRSGDEPIVARVPTRASQIAGLAATVLLFLFSVSVATFPGEWADEHIPTWTSLRELLFAGVNELSARPSSFSSRLVLNDQSFVDLDKLDKVEVSRSFRGRDLREAVLERADLRKADFTGANLYRAKLDGAKLQSTQFGCAIVSEQVFQCANLRRAWLQYAQLQGANLVQARLQGAVLTDAQLQGAGLNSAELQGAYFGAAHLQDADLSEAHLQGADLVQAQLQGAVLERAELQGANFEKANLQGAFLSGARLQGANFDRAQLLGAYLGKAELQGANFDKTQLRGGSLAEAQVWRTRGNPEIDLTNLNTVNMDAKPWEHSGAANSTFAAWRDGILGAIPAGEYRDAARERISTLDPAPGKEPKDVSHAEFWKKAISVAPQGEERQRRLATFLADLACSSRSAPYVARGLLRFGLNEAPGTQFAAMQERLRKGKSDQIDCPGAKGLTDKDWENLDELREIINGSHQ